MNRIIKNFVTHILYALESGFVYMISNDLFVDSIHWDIKFKNEIKNFSLLYSTYQNEYWIVIYILFYVQTWK
jgi:hypothetical protein